MNYGLAEFISIVFGAGTVIASMLYNHILQRRKYRFDLLHKIVETSVRTVEQEHKVRSDVGNPMDPGTRRVMAREMVHSLTNKFKVGQFDDETIMQMIEATVQQLKPSVQD